MKELTKPLIDSINPNDIIYAEYAVGGAMGNAGGVMYYTLEGETFLCYEANLFIDEEIYEQAVQLLLDNENQTITNNIQLSEGLFDCYDGGMGNYVFVNRNITLEIGKGYFILKKDNIEYQIFPSALGVFARLVQ